MLSAPTSAGYVITLVHGTFAREAGWIHEGSPLWQHLRTTLPSPIEIFPFVWSGHNSTNARKNAATDLRKQLRDQVESRPKAKHYVIARSHGGNVALYAIRDTELESRLDGLVCLSTPFLHVSSRDGALYESFYRTLCWVLIPILCFLLILLLRHVTRLSVPMAVAGAAVVGLLLLFCVRKYVSAKHKLLAKKVQGELSLPDLTCTRLLVIRAGGDEASGLLVSLQFMTWLLGYMWAIVVAFSQGFQSSFERFKQRLSSAMTQIAAGAILIALLLWLSSYEDIFHFEWSTIVIGLVVFISGFQILLQTPLLALALWQHILGFVSMPLVVIVGTLLSPFGPELVWSSILLEITAEATPPGAWRIYQLPASATSSQPGLKHSMTYTDTLALAAISDWLLNTEPRVAATNVRGA